MAKEAGLLYVSIAMATDNDCLCEAGERVSAARVVETFKKNANRVTKLIADVVKKIPEVNWDEDVKELEVSHTFTVVLLLTRAIVGRRQGERHGFVDVA